MGVHIYTDMFSFSSYTCLSILRTIYNISYVHSLCQPRLCTADATTYLVFPIMAVSHLNGGTLDYCQVQAYYISCAGLHLVKSCKHVCSDNFI